MGLQLRTLQWAVFFNFNMYKLAIFCVAVAGAYAAPEADAEPGYLVAPALYNAYPNWPGVSTPYFSSTCFGCRGKRSAEADADAYYGYGYAALPYYRPYLPGVAGHPTGTSFVARSPQGLGKRSADALYGYGIVPVTTSTYGYGPSGYGIAQGHPGYASSFQQVTRLH